MTTALSQSQFYVFVPIVENVTIVVVLLFTFSVEEIIQQQHDRPQEPRMTQYSTCCDHYFIKLEGLKTDSCQ